MGWLRQDGASRFDTALIIASFLAQHLKVDLKATSSPTEKTNTASPGSQPATNKTAARDITCKGSIRENGGTSCPSQINPLDNFTDCETEIQHQEASPVERSFREEACASWLSLISTLLSCGTGACDPIFRPCKFAGVSRRVPSLAFLMGVKSLSRDRLLFWRWCCLWSRSNATSDGRTLCLSASLATEYIIVRCWRILTWESAICECVCKVSTVLVWDFDSSAGNTLICWWIWPRNLQSQQVHASNLRAWNRNLSEFSEFQILPEISWNPLIADIVLNSFEISGTGHLGEVLEWVRLKV